MTARERLANYISKKAEFKRREKMNIISCYTCIFNNDDTCDEGNQYYYAEFGRDCPNYKVIHAEDARRSEKDQQPEQPGFIPERR
jgi:hypothetical protein